RNRNHESWLSSERCQDRDEICVVITKSAWSCLIGILVAVTPPILATDKPDSALTEGDNAYKSGNYDLAVTKYSEAIKRNPKEATAYNGRGLTYRGLKQYGEAIADFTEALRLKRAWFVFYNRAITYHEKDDEDAAIADFTAALKLKPNIVQGRI